MRVAIRTFILLSALLGVGYPLLVSAIGHTFWSYQVDGSLVRRSGQVIGSSLIGQPFHSPQYIHARPSANGYDADGLAKDHRLVTFAGLRAFAQSQHSAQPAMMTDSSSGVDPDLPVAAVQAQFPRVEKSCHVSSSQLQELLESHIESGILGPQVVNILKFNLALKSICHA